MSKKELLKQQILELTRLFDGFLPIPEELFNGFYGTVYRFLYLHWTCNPRIKELQITNVEIAYK